MGWLAACGELIGSTSAAFVKTKEKLQRQEICEATDFYPDETKQFIAKSLAECSPLSTDLTQWDRKSTEFNLGRNSLLFWFFASN